MNNNQPSKNGIDVMHFSTRFNGLKSPTVCCEFDEIQQVLFFKVLKKLSDLDCIYLSYSLERPNGVRTHFFSNPEWLRVFINEELYKDCLLTLQSRICPASSLLIWDTLKPGNKKQQIVTDSRRDHGIANGLTLINTFNGIREMVALATTLNNNKFVTNVGNNFARVIGAISELRQTLLHSK